MEHYRIKSTQWAIEYSSVTPLNLNRRRENIGLRRISSAPVLCAWLIVLGLTLTNQASLLQYGFIMKTI